MSASSAFIFLNLLVLLRSCEAYCLNSSRFMNLGPVISPILASLSSISRASSSFSRARSSYASSFCANFLATRALCCRNSASLSSPAAFCAAAMDFVRCSISPLSERTSASRPRTSPSPLEGSDSLAFSASSVSRRAAMVEGSVSAARRRFSSKSRCTCSSSCSALTSSLVLARTSVSRRVASLYRFSDALRFMRCSCMRSCNLASSSCSRRRLEVASSSSAKPSMPVVLRLSWLIFSVSCVRSSSSWSISRLSSPGASVLPLSLSTVLCVSLNSPCSSL
mmetsp:Transcript_121126/g.337369  ORF Transcript_121126/g.337369 Transcript_121126/m.337369 type:complete len:280 (-) Transcript_121126:467-1306(-)